jgi:Glu-tRNA(Gln) amidotransferase subunit E-like FAD-binding protein
MGILDKQRARKEEKIKKEEALEKQEKQEKKRAQKLKELKRATDLSKEEIQYLIKMIAHTKFDGLEMQIIYSITAKLQNQLKNKVKWDGKD